MTNRYEIVSHRTGIAVTLKGSDGQEYPLTFNSTMSAAWFMIDNGLNAFDYYWREKIG